MMDMNESIEAVRRVDLYLTGSLLWLLILFLASGVLVYVRQWYRRMVG